MGVTPNQKSISPLSPHDAWRFVRSWSLRGIARTKESCLGRLSGGIVDDRAGSVSVIERAFLIQSSARFSSFIQVGIFGLGAMARKLAAGGRRITSAASGVHGKWVVALNGPPRSW